MLYIFGSLLIYSGIRVCVMGDHRIDPSANPVVKALRRLIPSPPITRESDSSSATREDLRLYVTPLLAVLLVIETTDILFAVDSIPAILAITLNAFVVYTSNVFAILGLRSLYFAVSRLMKVFRFLHYGLAVVLILVGLKMIVAEYFRVSIPVTLGVVGGIILISVAISAVFPKASNR